MIFETIVHLLVRVQNNENSDVGIQSLADEKGNI